jgi:hypothetical protein
MAGPRRRSNTPPQKRAPPARSGSSSPAAPQTWPSCSTGAGGWWWGRRRGCGGCRPPGVWGCEGGGASHASVKPPAQTIFGPARHFGDGLVQTRRRSGPAPSPCHCDAAPVGSAPSPNQKRRAGTRQDAQKAGPRGPPVGKAPARPRPRPSRARRGQSGRLCKRRAWTAPGGRPGGTGLRKRGPGASRRRPEC